MKNYIQKVVCIVMLSSSIVINAQYSAGGKTVVYFNTPVDNSISTGVNAIYLNNCMADTLAAYISRAKYTIDIAQYDYSSSSVITPVTNAINAAHARGVVVRWIYDGSQPNSELVNLNSGVHKLGSPTGGVYGIMHHKFMIIDANSTNHNDPLVWTGSPDWSKTQFNSCHNNVIIIQDYALAQAYLAQFNQMWGGTGATPVPANEKFGPNKISQGPHSFVIGGRTVELYFSPADGTNSHIVSTIASANTDLYFGVYTFTESTNATNIVNKKNAGIYVAGIVDQYSTGTAYNTLNSGLGSKLITYANANYVYHNKYVIVDPSNFCSDPMVLTGSHNWTASADTKNDENVLIIHNDTIANIYYQAFHQNFTGLGGTLSTIANCASVGLSIAASPTGAICVGTSVTFTATPTGGGTPSYQWQVNGANVGTNSPTYSTTSLTNGQVVTCVITSGGNTTTSNSITMVVNGTLVPSTTISVTSGSNPTCAGVPIIFTAVPTNGGSTPTYQWKVNGANVGTNSASYTSSTLTTNSIVTCVMTSSSSCASPTTATSNSITVTVNSSLTPAVAISVTSGSNPTCAGMPITFTAAPTNGGSTPTYQWKANGTNVGTNNTSYTSSALANNSTVTCVMTSSSSCASPISATSTGITLVVNAVPNTPTISQNGATLTSSDPNGNQWYMNGTIISGATNQTYNATQPGNYTVIETTNGCSSAVSSPVNITTTGINETTNIVVFEIYPNPNNGEFIFNGLDTASKIEIFNMTGQLVYQTVSNNLSQLINLSNKPSGIYFYRISTDSKYHHGKIFIE
jgi:hypothetical protein